MESIIHCGWYEYNIEKVKSGWLRTAIAEKRCSLLRCLWRKSLTCIVDRAATVEANTSAPAGVKLGMNLVQLII